MKCQKYKPLCKLDLTEPDRTKPRKAERLPLRVKQFKFKLKDSSLSVFDIDEHRWMQSE